MLTPEGEYGMLYTIIVGPIVLFVMLMPLYCLISIILDVIKIYKGIRLSKLDLSGDNEYMMKQSKFLVTSSIVTINLVSAGFYYVVKNQINEERVMRMRRSQDYAMQNYPMQNYPTQNYLAHNSQSNW